MLAIRIPGYHTIAIDRETQLCSLMLAIRPFQCFLFQFCGLPYLQLINEGVIYRAVLHDLNCFEL